MQVADDDSIDANDKESVKKAFLAAEETLYADVQREWESIGATRPPSPLYHYTTAAGMKGIIENGSLYLTNALYLGDTSELVYGLELATRMIASRAMNVPAILCNFFERRLKEFDPFRNAPDVAFYAASFCERRDLLSQWRLYADGAAGYALGFTSDALRDRANFADKTAPPVALLRVEYKRSHQLHLLDFVLNWCCEFLEKNLATATNERERKVLEVGWSGVVAIQLLQLFPRFKNPLFSEECEWRLGCLLRQQNDNPSFRPVGRSLVPYIDYPLRLESSNLLPLTELVVGPR